jgi:hypothetical protein
MPNRRAALSCIIIVIAVGTISLDRSLSQVRAQDAPKPTETVRPASLKHTYHAKYHTIAHEMLDNEAALGAVTQDMFNLLDDVIDWSKAALPERNPSQYANLTDADASAVLHTIDKVLYTHGFVYPGFEMGWVDLLSDGLTPRTLNATELQSVRQMAENNRRLPDIDRLAPGPFYLVDCDIASFLYLAVADQLGMPLSMVNLPDHDFVRWNLGSNKHLDFETMYGADEDDNHYHDHGQTPGSIEAGLFMSSWTRSETLGYHTAIVASKWADMNDFQRERDTGVYAVALYPAFPNAWNQIAWADVMSNNPAIRKAPSTLTEAQKSIVPFAYANNLDTLACAYAEGGRWDLARQTEIKATKAYNDFPDAVDFSKYLPDFTPPTNKTCYIARSATSQKPSPAHAGN